MSSSSRSLVDDVDDTLEIEPDRCQRCDISLAGAEESGRQRRQVVDLRPVSPPKVTEYQRVSKVCPCCGAVTTPGWDDEAVPVEHAETVAAPGSPVRIGPGQGLARAALLTCAHYLPVGRARDLLGALTAVSVSTGFLAGIPRPRGAAVGEEVPRPHADVAGQRAAADFAIVQSYLDTANRWGVDKLDALRQLFTTGAWLPPALTPAE